MLRRFIAINIYPVKTYFSFKQKNDWSPLFQIELIWYAMALKKYYLCWNKEIFEIYKCLKSPIDFVSFKSPNTENIAEFIVSRLRDQILLIESPVNKISKLKCETPEEFDFSKYWSWINYQICPLIDHFIRNKTNNPINLIYIGDGDNSPNILYQYFQDFLKNSDFDISNTENEIYGWLSIEI